MKKIKTWIELWYGRHRYDISDFFYWTSGVFGVLVTLLAVLLVVGTIAMRVSLPGELAEIESIRHDAALVTPGSDEGVLRLAAEKNATIASYQRQNTLWWCGWTVPDEWDSVEPIAIGAQVSPSPGKP